MTTCSIRCRVTRGSREEHHSGHDSRRAATNTVYLEWLYPDIGTRKRSKQKLSSFLPVFGGRVSSSHQAGTSICIPHQIQKASTRHLHPHQIQKTSMKHPHPHPHSMRSSRAVPRLAISDRFAGSDPCTTEMAAHSPPVRGPDDNCFCKSVGG